MTSSTPPLKCERCGISEDDFVGKGKKSRWGILCDLSVDDGRHTFQMEYLPKEPVISTNPTAEPKCEHGKIIGKTCAFGECAGNNCVAIQPTTETKSVEEEWEKEFDEKFPAMGVCGDPKDHCVYRFDQYINDRSEIKSFITTLLHDERERGRVEAVEYINTNLMWARSKDKKSLEIYPEHIAEVLEAAKKSSSLRDKLTK